MLPGTRKMFGRDYEEFKKAIVEAAEFDALPVAMQVNDAAKHTMRDLQEVFYDVVNDTGLIMTGNLFLCPDCKRLHLLLEINMPEEDEKHILH